MNTNEINIILEAKRRAEERIEQNRLRREKQKEEFYKRLAEQQAAERKENENV